MTKVLFRYIDLKDLKSVTYVVRVESGREGWKRKNLNKNRAEKEKAPKNMFDVRKRK